MKVLFNQYLKNYNTIRIGGKVRWMFFPVNASEIIEAIKFAWDNKATFFILAGGSNTVFDDVGMNSRQVVINLSEMDNVEINNTNQNCSKTKVCHPELVSGSKKLGVELLIIQCDPGVPLQKIVDTALKNNAGGIVGINRVPGTIGGAVVGNAGAYGCETMSFVEKVEYVDLDEIIKQPNWVNIHTLRNKDCHFGYRDSIFKHNKNWLITNIHLKISIDQDISKAISKYNEIAIKRDKIYPKGFASPGSLFKNILFNTLALEVQKNIDPSWVMYGNKLPVGKLLESLGLQGFTHRKIQMRPTHANIMTNLGGATYKDAKKTVEILQAKVKERFGIDIEPEVRFIDGDFTKFWR